MKKQTADRITGWTVALFLLGCSLVYAFRTERVAAMFIAITWAVGFIVVAAGVGMWARRSGRLDHTDRKNTISGPDSWGTF